MPLLALCQLLLLGLLLWAPLPNVGNVGEELRRGIFLMAAIPGMVPDLPFRETITGQALEQLSQLENLPQRLPIVLAATLIAGAAAGLGRLVLVLLRLDQKFSTWEILPLSFGLGVLALAAITLGIGRLGLLDPWLVRLGLAACLLVGWGMPAIRSLTDRHKINEKLSTFQLVSTNWPATLGLFLIAAPFLTLMALGAMQPTIEYDALEYHLQGPKEFYQSGRIAFLPHNVYTSMPFGVEMLHLLGMLVLDDWWKGALVGQLLIASFAPATAAMIALTAFRIGSARAAWIAAVIYISTPWVFRLATYPFVEGPLCFYHAALIWIIFKTFVDNNNRDLNDKPALRPPPSAISPPPSVIRPPPSVLRHQSSVLRHQSSVLRHWFIIGALSGGAMVCKYPGLVSAVVPFGLLAIFIAWRQRAWRILPAFAVGVAVVVSPWLIRNGIDTGNPVYPLAFDIFGGSHWNEELDVKWWRAHGPKPFSTQALAVGLLDVAGRSDWQSPLYALLVPLALLRTGSRRFGLAIWSYILYLFATWFLLTHRLDRFWLPLLPAAAILAGLGADWTRGRFWSFWLAILLGVSISANLAFVSTPLSGPIDWTANLDDLRALGPGVLSLPDQPSPLARLDDEVDADADADADALVLMIGQAGVFHQRHKLRYNTVFNLELLEEIAKGRPPEAISKELARLGITHLYVDWVEVERHRKPGGYGFTDFIDRDLFENLVRNQVLEPPNRLGNDHWLYRVRPLQNGR